MEAQTRPRIPGENDWGFAVLTLKRPNGCLKSLMYGQFSCPAVNKFVEKFRWEI